MLRREFLLRALSLGSGAMTALVLPPMSARAADQDTVETTIESAPYTYPLASGAHFRGLAFDGQVPGRLLRVRYGQNFRARYINRSGGPSTIHWHGMILPNDMDGVPDVTQKPVPDGGEFLYTFKPDPPGLRWYHSHVLPQLGLGLFGPFLVEDPREKPADVEVVLVLHDVPDLNSFRAAVEGISRAPMDMPPGLGPEGMLAMAAGAPGAHMPGMKGMKGGNSMGDEVAYLSHCISGAAYPHTRPIIVKVGQTVRIRLLNASPTMTHYVRLAEHRLLVSHSDGNPLPRSVTVDALRIGVAERYDAWFQVTRPGAWLLESLMADAGDLRQAVLIRTPGATGVTPRRPPPSLDGAELFNYRMAGAAEPAGSSARRPDPPANVRVTLTLGGGKPGERYWTIDGKIWPHTPRVRVHWGDWVEIGFKNPTDMDHPMHLHGHVFTLTEIAGETLKYPLPKDTTLVPGNGGTATWRFRANSPPGRWLLHCHNEVHMMDGMMTELDYV